MKSRTNISITLLGIISMLLAFQWACKKESDPDDNNNDPGPVTGTVSDIDGNQYKTVNIGEQVWMAEDLKVTRYNDGAPIINDTSGYYTPDSTKSTPLSSRGNKYYHVKGSNICPAGWHLPSKQEWRDLVGFVAHDNNGIHGGKEATALKATGGWIENGNGTDDYGFTARANGVYIAKDTTVIHVGEAGYWLSSDVAYSGPWIRYIWHYNTTVNESIGSWKNGISIRCMKD